MRYLVLLLLTCFLGGNVNAAGLPKSIEKKISKSISKVWPAVELEREKLVIQPEILSRHGLSRVSAYQLKEGEEVKGYLCFSSAKGRYDKFDYLVIYDKDLVIRRITVLVYRSSYGGEIMAQSWLKQFYGKKNGEDMEFEKDIDSISGATLSAPAMTDSVKALSELMADLKAKELL
jgi:Na+-translocating ferredoxin:NAD+ oxidoreductase RnfG subunit